MTFSNGFLSWRAARPWAVAIGALVALAILLRLTVLAPPVVSVAEIMRGDLPNEVEGTGTVTADVLANIASEITGRVEGVSVDEGDFVRKGEIVATLDQTGLRHRLEAAQARVAAAQAVAAERRREWGREMGLVRTGAASVEDSQQYTERLNVAQSALRAAQAEAGAVQYQLSLTQIPALFSGIVTQRWVVPGASVVPGETIFTVADTRLIYVRAHVDQDFSGQVAKGEAATVILRGRPNEPLPGTVLRLSPQADAATEETVAEVAFTIPREQFQLGQWANVFIRVRMVKDALLVPAPAIMRMMGRSFVFTVDAHDVVHRRTVRILARSPREPLVAVAAPLQPRELVVLMPMGVRSGMRVRPRPMGHGSPMVMGGAPSRQGPG